MPVPFDLPADSFSTLDRCLSCLYSYGLDQASGVEGRYGYDREGTIAGIHAKVVELTDGRLLAFGRAASINERMPMSISDDLGKTWTYKASPFPPIGGGQRLVLKRLQEGPLLFVSFTSGNRSKPEANGMTFTDQNGKELTGHGMYAAVSFDDGKTWPVRKLLTPGKGTFDGGHGQRNSRPHRRGPNTRVTLRQHKLLTE